ncbi:ciliogenesis-associated TTC17-interacting protein [Coccinella septempunctata]|uniref:ciliogenesis-associated TTC17-interacting protein n=1 Tax=Coccinella septempunctata TaxID=41139 RepID=UPI001D07AB51|nr:ciliogenesis-associated TTC17-interacting protein [Coccinella septempunctata]
MSATNVQENNDEREIENVMEDLLTTVDEVEEQQDAIEKYLENVDEDEENEQLIDYHEQVLRYLKDQEFYVPEEDVEVRDFPEMEPQEVIQGAAKHVLMQLLTDVDNITAFKEAYSKKKELSNQYQLFDLTQLIPNFHINDKVVDMLSFRETLMISKVDNKGQVEPVGGLCLDVQTALGAKWDKPRKVPDFTKALMDACVDIKKRYSEESKEQTRKDLEEYAKFLDEEMRKHQKKFLVHMSTQFNVDGKNAGSRLTSWVDRNLHTLEEKRTEYIIAQGKEENILDQKQLYIYIGKKHYDVRVQPAKDYCKKYCYSFRRARDFLSEGANFILMRYLAIVKFIGQFELSSIHIEGGLCRNIYQCDGPLGGYINNEKMDLYKVYRTIVEECGIIHRSCTILSLDGRIMKHDWEKCDYVLQINPIVSPAQKKRATMILHFDEAWKHDLQLFSKYLDKKSAASFHMKSYLYDHKEIGSLINDYVQNILQIKPENIIQFTKHFFLSYAPYLLPRAEYFEQDVNKCFYGEDVEGNDI